MTIQVIPILTSPDPDADVDRGAQLLEEGGLVVLPTETVYGVAGRVDLPETRKRLQAHRASNETKPWTLHLPDPGQVWDFVPDPSEFVKRLVRKLLPGPVGLIFDVPAEQRAALAAKLQMDEHEVFENGTITLRCPDHPLFQEVVARQAGTVALTKLGDVTSQLPANFSSSELDVDLALDGGPTRFSKPSTLLRVHADKYEIVREGVYDQRIIERQLKTTLLFVCSGNTCRSPMAEALTRKIIAESLGVNESQLEGKGFNVISAGVFALPGTRAAPQAVEVLRNMSGDLSRHRSQPLTQELVHQADAIYAMGRSHAAAIQAMSSRAASKLKLLDPAGDIDDPIGSDVETYRSLAQVMEKLIRSRLKEDQIIA